jgi:hypothetical protein
MTSTGKGVLLTGLMALGLSASATANDTRVFTLKHPAPRVGEAFSVEHRTRFVLQTVGGPEEGRMETTSAFKVRILKSEGARFLTRLEIAPASMMTEMHGKVEKEAAPERRFEGLLDASEISLLPAPDGRGEGVGALKAKESVKVGESWTCERAIPFQKTMSVPIKATYTVASVEKDPNGHDLLRLVLKSEGCLEIKGTQVKVTVAGDGEALVDPERADRPLQVNVSYRFATSGGEGADTETRTETTIRTHDLGVAAETSSVSAQEKSR